MDNVKTVYPPQTQFAGDIIRCRYVQTNHYDIINLNTVNILEPEHDKTITRAGIYETLCPQHMLPPKDNLQMTNFRSIPLDEFPCQMG